MRAAFPVMNWSMAEGVDEEHAIGDTPGDSGRLRDSGGYGSDVDDRHVPRAQSGSTGVRLDRTKKRSPRQVGWELW